LSLNHTAVNTVAHFGQIRQD